MAVGIASFEELNDRFLAWCETVANHRIHAETNRAPVEAFLTGHTPRLADPATVFEAFRWSVVRRVAKTATVEFEANRYQVDPALVGRHVELRFDPEDLTRIEVYCEGVACGPAVPLVIGRHVHPAVPQASPAASSPNPRPPGIDYLGLVLAAHEEATFGPIAYRDIPVSGEGEAPCPPVGHDPEDHDPEGHDPDREVL